MYVDYNLVRFYRLKSISTNFYDEGILVDTEYHCLRGPTYSQIVRYAIVLFKHLFLAADAVYRLSPSVFEEDAIR